jgi:hypothetical protein
MRPNLSHVHLAFESRLYVNVTLNGWEPAVAGGGTDVDAGNQRRTLVDNGMSVIDRGPGQRKLGRSAVDSLKNGVADT